MKEELEELMAEIKRTANKVRGKLKGQHTSADSRIGSVTRALYIHVRRVCYAATVGHN